MKKLVTFLVILVMGLTAAMAQSAAKLNYQAVVRSSDNHLASNETVNVTIDIKVSGTSVFSETHNAVNTNINGLLNLIIGEGTAQTGDLATIDWAHAVIDATITWGSNTVTTSNPVYAVPLALSANVDCSDVVDCVDNAIANGSSTTNHAIDTVIVNHLTPYEIKNCDDVVACPIIQNMRDSIQSNYEEIQHLTTDLNTLETRVETFNTHVCDSVKDCVAAQIHDSLVPYTIKNCDNVIACVDNAIADGTSTTNHAIDTVVAHSIHDSLVPYQIKDCADVTDCVNSAIADGTSETNHAIDTVVSSIVRDSLVPYTIKNCGDVVDCVKTEIENGGSDLNHTIDTLVANNIHDSLVNYTIKDCADVMACPDIQRMRDSIQTNHTDIQTVQTELSTLETRVETFNTHVCDSVKDCVAAQIHDSLVAHPVYNSTITFHQEGGTDQSITLNQSTNQTINIVTFSQKSDRFIATAGLTDFDLTVPSGKTLDATDHLVQMYINGVYVGDTVDGVVKMSGTTAQYQSDRNGYYTLVAGDRVNFVFWVK